MFHSSALPIALPVSVIFGFITYALMQSGGHDPATSALYAKVIAVLLNVMIGVPKNLLVGDLLSLIFMRPVSAGAAYWSVDNVLHLINSSTATGSH